MIAARKKSARFVNMRHIRRIALVVCCSFLLSSCTVRIAYSVLDNILGWQLGQYVSLKGEQKTQSKRMFKDFHAWHRRTQLPLYANYLDTLKEGMLAGDITSGYLHDESDKLQDLMDISLAKLMPGLTEVAISLDEKQIQEVVEQLEKEREEYREDYIEDSEEKIQKRRIQDLTRYIGGFFGSFTDEQEAILKNWEENLIPHEKLMLSQQLQWQEAFLEAMQDRADFDQLQRKLHALLLFRTDNWDPELQKALDVNQEQTFKMLATLFNSQTPKQKKKLENKFDQYIKDLRILASKAENSKLRTADTAKVNSAG